MQTETATPETPDLFFPTSLHHLINRITGSLSPATRRNKIVIINNVPGDICSHINENHVASVLSRLMNVIIMHTENSYIRISAKVIGNIVLLHIKDDGCLSYDSVSHQLTEIQAQAEKIGGFVGFTSFKNKLTTIAFSFINYETTCLKAYSRPE
jgi:glucose-6-phosphate-specific signal transduction histidine kinase